MNTNLKKQDVEFLENLNEKIKEFIGKKVIVYIGGLERNNFEPQISVSGILEEHPQHKDNYRVLCIDNDNYDNTQSYAYFTNKQLKRIVANETYTFKNGSLAIIQISINSKF